MEEEAATEAEQLCEPDTINVSGDQTILLAEQAAEEAAATATATTTATATVTVAGITVTVTATAEATVEVEEEAATAAVTQGEATEEEAAFGGGASGRQIWDQSRVFDPGT